MELLKLAEKKIHMLEEKVAPLCFSLRTRRTKKASKANHTLIQNMACLFHTAQTEIQHKDV
jgi:hypothetical protein